MELGYCCSLEEISSVVLLETSLGFKTTFKRLVSSGTWSSVCDTLISNNIQVIFNVFFFFFYFFNMQSLGLVSVSPLFSRDSVSVGAILTTMLAIRPEIFSKSLEILGRCSAERVT